MLANVYGCSLCIPEVGVERERERRFRDGLTIASNRLEHRSKSNILGNLEVLGVLAFHEILIIRYDTINTYTG